MRRVSGLMAVVSMLVMQSTLAAPVKEELDAQWLKRVALMSRQLHYQGVYLHQRGHHTDTVRLTHWGDERADSDKREALDGRPRECLRTDQRIVCYFAAGKPVRLEQGSARLQFPAVFNERAGELLAWYRLQAAEPARVAGIEAVTVWLEPKDGYRHPVKLWVDPNTRLLLKLAFYNAQREPIETLAFTQVSVEKNLDKQLLKPKLAAVRADAEPAPVSDLLPGSVDWEVRQPPPGYTLRSEGLRQVRGKHKPLTFLLYSDGLSDVSIFIEPAAPLADASKDTSGNHTVGGVTARTRRIGNWQATVVSEAPVATIDYFAAQLGAKARP
jgi:sigma-E factor negative regulatory protein RseB